MSLGYHLCPKGKTFYCRCFFTSRDICSVCLLQPYPLASFRACRGILAAAVKSRLPSVVESCGENLPPLLLGDLDEDKKLTNTDLTLMLRVLSGWDIAYDAAAVDVTGDGKLNNRDAIALIKKVNAA